MSTPTKAELLKDLSRLADDADDAHVAWTTAIKARDDKVVEAIAAVDADGIKILRKADIARAIRVKRENIYNIVNRRT